MGTRIKISDKFISDGCRSFIIAEIGVNHNGSVEIAKQLIDAAKEAGADVVKFQIFKAEKLVSPSAELVGYQRKNIGKKVSQYEMLKRLELDYSDFERLKEYCDDREIIFMATPHSCKEDINIVSDLCPAIKIGSGDLTNLPMLEYAAKKKLPIILSTGMSTLDEIREAVNVILPINKDVVLLHCVTNYPLSVSDVNLRAMNTMREEFRLPVGFSDHTRGIEVSVAAVALGACVIEKHFTLDRSMEGPDHRASLEPHEFRKMVKEIRNTEERIRQGEDFISIINNLGMREALGDGIKRPNPQELEIARIVRKGIKAMVDIPKGSIVSEEKVIIKRPATGTEPKYLNEVIGKTAKRDIKKDEAIFLKDSI